MTAQSESAALLPVAEVQREGQTFRIAGVHRDDHIWKAIDTTGQFYEKELLESSVDHLRAGGLVVDVGANIGNHSVFWAGACGASVLSVEPEPTVFEALRKNIVLNDLEERMFPRRIAAGARRGHGTLSPLDAKNSGRTTLVVEDGPTRIRALDDFPEVRSSPVDVLKIDVEGMELDVLRGASRLLENGSPAVYCECNSDDSFAEVEEYLAGMRYSAVDVFNFSPTYLFIKVGDDRDEARAIECRTAFRNAQRIQRLGVEVAKIRALATR